MTLGLLMGRGWPISCCGNVAGFGIVAVALLTPIYSVERLEI